MHVVTGRTLTCSTVYIPCALPTLVTLKSNNVWLTCTLSCVHGTSNRAGDWSITARWIAVAGLR